LIRNCFLKSHSLSGLHKGVFSNLHSSSMASHSFIIIVGTICSGLNFNPSCQLSHNFTSLHCIAILAYHNTHAGNLMSLYTYIDQTEQEHSISEILLNPFFYTHSWTWNTQEIAINRIRWKYNVECIVFYGRVSVPGRHRHLATFPHIPFGIRFG